MLYVFTKKCPCCEKMRYTVERRRMNTAYHDEESNFIVCCAECFADTEEYWAERWADYYNGCM